VVFEAFRATLMMPGGSYRNAASPSPDQQSVVFSPGETDWQRVLRFAWDYWLVDMVKANLVQAHPVQRGKGLLAKFGNLFEGFQQILDRKPEYLGRLEIHAKLLLVSKGKGEWTLSQDR
jgi:hypothetical protein